MIMQPFGASHVHVGALGSAQATGRRGVHAHIMPIVDLGQGGGQPYWVLPLIGRGDVEGMIKKPTGHRIPLEQAINTAKSVSRGLQFGNARGIVHRDLKPHNVRLTADGPVKIGDCCLALPCDWPLLAMEGMMLGTAFSSAIAPDSCKIPFKIPLSWRQRP